MSKEISKRVELEGAMLSGEVKPISEFDGLVAKLRLSMSENWISMVDSDAYKLYVYLHEHPEFDPEVRDTRIEILNTIVKTAWKAPGWEDALNRLRTPRLEAETP